MTAHPALATLPERVQRVVETDRTVNHVLVVLDAVMHASAAGMRWTPQALWRALQSAWLHVDEACTCGRMQQEPEPTGSGVLNAEYANASTARAANAAVLPGEEEVYFASEFWDIVLAEGAVERGAYLEDHLEFTLDCDDARTHLRSFALRTFGLEADLPDAAAQARAIARRKQAEEQRRGWRYRRATEE
jgi:hypothetical protein